MKRIFIGSSTEALTQALKIEAILSRVPGIEVLCWQDAFPLGSLTFEAIERLVDDLTGAIIIASPDDVCKRRRAKGSSRKNSPCPPCRVPRANVMIEWGLLTGILGRDRVILCWYEGVNKPSDLLAITYCPMGVFSRKRRILGAAKEQLVRWAKGLPRVAHGVPSALVGHGYSGLWNVTID